jgi:F0F1-type ATP synthase gamma subunit
MAGQLKEVRNRIKSIQSTQQITAMKMISATKLRKAQSDSADAALFQNFNRCLAILATAMVT